MSNYSKIFEEWNAEQENRKALFTEFLYQRSGRTNGLFTGLWDQWCRESGEQAVKNISLLLNLEKVK